eukprot:jgi/Psemu1/256376/estExt_Genewise1Plus.C_1810009
MTVRRSSFLFLLVAVARTDSWLDTAVPYALALVVNRHVQRSWIDGQNNVKRYSGGKSCLYSSLAPPQRGHVGGGIDDDRDDNINDGYYFNYEQYRQSSEKELQGEQEELSHLYDLVQAEPRDLLRFEYDEPNGLRGMYLNRSVKNGDVVLKIPLGSCLRDDRTPSWLPDEVKDDPYRWATRLAASLADLHLQNKLMEAAAPSPPNSGTQPLGIKKSYKTWSSLLPDSEYLTASLPVHWPETIVLNARSTALELAVDSAFFARAQAVDDLVRGLEESPYADLFSNHHGRHGMSTGINMKDLAHHVLDLVQTRSFRLNERSGAEDRTNNDGLRVLAPIFDFINHGSIQAEAANAQFALERDETAEYLVVRSLTDVSKDEEVRIDYGENTRPAWKCLLSYGFVPDYKRTESDVDSGENLAEVYMKGVRYEVADDSVPADMVADASPQEWVEVEDDGIQTNGDFVKPPIIVLTPDIALRISERIANAACYLLLEPEQILDEDATDTAPPSPSEVISARLAAKLRWFQHKVLLTCAAGLTQFAKEQETSFW